MTETRLTADLPELTLELRHILHEDGQGETLTIGLIAPAGFAALLRPDLVRGALLAPVTPDIRSLAAPLGLGIQLWSAVMGASLAPWMGAWQGFTDARRGR
ncbi:MAG: hypothetical protein HXY25_06845 [Alphaproteobacteria bacterium]|nr:hypothetical protein [Alphaproteobacteria bacterium]